MSHSYSPLTRLLYIFARDERRVFTKNDVRHAAEGNNASPTGVEAVGGPAATNGGGRGGRGGGGGGNGIFGGGGNLPVSMTVGGGRGRARFAPEESWGKVVAVDPLTGVIKWEHKTLTPPWGGVMSTAGNLVFGGTPEGVVFALDARTGERLWYFGANERVYASPISYLSKGKQYISLPVGDVLITFGL
jgi:outer membrane protein assembly factor BamB